MTTSKILTILLTSMLLAGGATEAFAWTKNFSGTRDQVRNACVGAGKTLVEGTHTSTCGSVNGNVVTCNNDGNCAGSGPGPLPRQVNTAEGVLGTVLGLRAKVDLRAFGFDADGNSPTVHAPVKDAPLPDSM